MTTLLNQQLSVLEIGLPPQQLLFGTPTLHVLNASTASEAMRLLHVRHFDLLLLAPRLPDLSPWTLIRQIKSRWPRQRWAMVAEDLKPHEEVSARLLGVLTIFARHPTRYLLSSMADGIRMRQGLPSALTA